MSTENTIDQLEPESPIKPIGQLRRMTQRFERLRGKTVDRVGYGGQFMWIVFTDGTYVFLDASDFSMEYDSDIGDKWQVDIGLMSQEEKNEKDKAAAERSRARKESFERKELERLKAKYERVK